MSNLKLVPDDPTPLEKILLDASRNELPSDEHKNKLRAVLGIGLPLSVPPPASATAPTAQGAAASSPTAAVPVAAAAKSTVAAKVALGVAALAVVGAFMLTRGTAPAPVTSKAPAAPQAVVAPAPAPVAAVPEPPATPEVSPLPPVEPTTAAARAARAGGSASAAEDLSEQIRLIEAARSGVASHDSKSALTALNTYTARFPHGSFGQEATVLRIRALDQGGDSARATAMAKSFVARFPNSPHVARLKPIAERAASR